MLCLRAAVFLQAWVISLKNSVNFHTIRGAGFVQQFLFISEPTKAQGGEVTYLSKVLQMLSAQVWVGTQAELIVQHGWILLHVLVRWPSPPVCTLSHLHHLKAKLRSRSTFLT